MKLVDFLTKVVSDRGFREKFCEDPKATITNADLSGDAQEAIRSGDPKRVALVICGGEVAGMLRVDPID